MFGVTQKEVDFLWDYLIPEVPFTEVVPDEPMELTEAYIGTTARGLQIFGTKIFGDISFFNKRDLAHLTEMKRYGFSYRGGLPEHLRSKNE